MTWGVVWTFGHVVGWAVYVGGAIVMEWVWRPAQAHLPAAQTAEACRRMGRRYRWLALGSLVAIGATGWARMAEDDSGPSLSLDHAYGRTLWALVGMWVALLALVAVLAVVAHPALHRRVPSELDTTQIAASREEVRRAITRMDRVLRADLVVVLIAALLGASLAAGGAL